MGKHRRSEVKIENDAWFMLCVECNQWKVETDFIAQGKVKKFLGLKCSQCRNKVKKQRLVIPKVPHQIIDGIENKHCPSCNEWKPISRFSIDKSRYDGLNIRCKRCMADCLANSTVESKSRRAQYQEEYLRKNKDILSDRRKAKRLANKKPDNNLRQCVDCKGYFDKGLLNHIKLPSTKSYLCQPCLEARKRRTEEKELKKQERLKSVEEARQKREYEKQLRKLAKAEEKQRQKVERESTRIAYLQSDEYKEKQREQRRQEHQRQAKKRKEQGIPSKITAYYQSNPGKKRQHKLNRRAAEYGAGGSYNQSDWDYLVELCDNRCLKCGCILTSNNDETMLTHDHILPLFSGGSNTITNLQPYCRSCNCSKGYRRYEDSRTEEIKHLIYKRAFPNLMEMMEEQEAGLVPVFFDFRDKL